MLNKPCLGLPERKELSMVFFQEVLLVAVWLKFPRGLSFEGPPRNIEVRYSSICFFMCAWGTGSSAK